VRPVLDRLARTERTLLVGPTAGSTASERPSEPATRGTEPAAGADPGDGTGTAAPIPDAVRRFCRTHNVAVSVDHGLSPGTCRVVAAGEPIADGAVEELARYVTGAGAGSDAATDRHPGDDGEPDPADGTGTLAESDGDVDAADWSGEGDDPDWSGEGDAIGDDAGRDRPTIVDAVVGTESAVAAASTAEMVRISREIERRAWRAGGGRLRAGFQELSVLVESTGTRSQYVRLASAGVDVVVYGYPDVDPSTVTDAGDGVDVVVDDEEAVRDYWFVLFDGAGDDRTAAALVCEVDEDDRFTGYWTRSAPLVRDCFRLAAEAHPDLFDDAPVGRGG